MTQPALHISSSLARIVCVLALLVVATGAGAADAGAASRAVATAGAVELDGTPFVTAAALRRHVVRHGRGWEPFLDANSVVVRAFRLRVVVYRGRTYYSRAALASWLWRHGVAYSRWARKHPVRAAWLRYNKGAKIPGRPTPPPAPAPIAPPPAPEPAPAPAPAPAPEPAPEPAPPPAPAPAPPPAPAPAPAPAPPPAPAATGTRVGVSLDNPEYAPADQRTRQLDDVDAVGAGWVRFDIKWTDVQWDGSSSFNWGRYDVLVDGARARGLQVLANLAYSPTWARPAGTSDKFAPDTTQRREAYARFAAAAASRYRGRVSAWEVWNEPNNTMFWQPAPNAASYAALLQHAYRAIKDADSAATVVAGATSPAASSGGMIDEVQFLQSVYAAGGGGHFDAWSHHPYDFNLAPGTAHRDSAWWQMYGSSPSIRSLMEANGDGAKRLWATEHGVPSSGYGSLTEATQAGWLSQAHQLWRGFTWSGPLFNYMMRDSASPGNAGYWYYMGLARDDWSRKPAFAVIQQAASL